jgi:hypothetical protein
VNAVVRRPIGKQSEKAVTAKYLTFMIDAGSKSGTLVITGSFDHAYGFSVSVDGKDQSTFSAEGITLKKGEKESTEFAVSIREPFQKHRFNLKFAKLEDTRYSFQHTGEIVIGGIAIVDAPQRLY